MYTDLWRWCYIGGAYGLIRLAWNGIWNRDDPARGVWRGEYWGGQITAGHQCSWKYGNNKTQTTPWHLSSSCTRSKRPSHNSAVPHNVSLNVISSHAGGSQTGTTWQLSKKDELQSIVNPSVWSQFESPSWECLKRACSKNQHRLNLITAARVAAQTHNAETIHTDLNVNMQPHARSHITPESGLGARIFGLAGLKSDLKQQ